MRWFLKMFILIAFMEMCVAQEQVTGPVEIFGMVYERVDPGPPFKEQRRKYEPWQLTPPTDIERACGFIAFSRGEPFDIKPWSKPRASERISELTVQLARGEFESCWFAIHALEALERISIGVKSFGNGKMPSVTIMRAHYWAQRVTWKGRTYYIVPELLLPIDDGYSLYPAKGGTLVRKPFNLRCGECGLIWLLVHAPSDLPAGEYRFSITVHAEGMKMRAIPLKIRILPFQLRKPVKKRWLLYGDVWYWGSLSDDNVFAILRDMAEHGIDGLTEMPFGKVDVSQIANGVVKYDPTPLLRLHRMMRRVGMRGPITIGRYVEREIAKALGIKANLWRGDWDDRLKDALRLVARTVTNELKRYGINWFFYAVDEPSPQNTYALQQYRCWHEGGAKTYVTFYRRGTFEKMGDWMDAPCFSVGLINYKDGAKWARNECRRRGKLFFWYGSGCYLGQEGRMFPNRYLAGFLFLKTDADAQVSWTFMRPHEDPFNDFDGVRANSAEPKDQCIVYPQLERPNDRSSFVKIIPTIQWEALREGIDDYRYAYTLRNLIAYARDKASSLLAFNTPMLIYAKGGALWALPIRNDGTPIRSVKAVRICAVTGNDAISKIAISGDGRYLAFEIDRTLFVWDVRKRAMKKLAGAGNPAFPLQGHALAFLRYRSKFKSDAWLWDLDANAKRLLRKDVHGLIWRADGVELALMPNPLANKLPIVVGVNGKVKFRPHRKPSAPLRSITLSPDGRFLGSYEGLSSPPEMGKIFDRRTGKVFMLPPGKAFYDWSRDGKRLLFEWAVLARNGSYRGIQLGIWEGGKARYVVKMSALKGKSLRTARFAPDGCNFLYQCDGELWWSDLRGRYQRKVLNGISAFTVWHPTKYALRLLREAKDAESELNALIDAVPWGNEVRKVGFTNAHLQRVRHAIANRIVHLVNAIEGKPLRMPKRRRLKLRISLLPPTSALAKPVPTIVIPRVDTPPSIDGKLDDACWRVAGIASQFREHLTGEPMPREIQTYALAGFDMQALYVAFVCAERDIARVRAPRTGRDPHGIWIDDSVELFIAHPHERSRYAHFIVNAAGALYDEVGQDVSWNANVRVATNRKSVALPRALVDLRGRAWCVEMAIPWRELPFKFSPRNDGASLLINFCRNHNTGANEVAHSAWSATFGWFHNPDRFGIAILQRGDISVQLVEVPRLWGRQNLTVRLINCVAQRKVVKVSAYVKSARASSWRRHISVPLESRGHSTVRIPLTLSDVGDVVIILRVKSDDVVSEIPIATRIPQPIEATAPVVFAEDGVARIGWQINLAQSEWHRKLKLQIESVGRTIATATMLARPNSTRTLTVGMRTSRCTVHCAFIPRKSTLKVSSVRVIALP